MLHLLKRHPFPMEAHFEFTLVLTYALPADVLEPLLPPGLVVDKFGDLGFLAIAMVQTKAMRPKGLPDWLGQDFFLTGYRIFTRYETNSGQHLRGLRILRSDTDKALMTTFGNMFTHYKYEHSDVICKKHDGKLDVLVKTKTGAADLDVTIELPPHTSKNGSDEGPLPAGSPFETARDARKYQGPLPFTFDYESETNSIIRVEGVRSNWQPHLVNATVREVKYLNRFEQQPVLASAFYIEDIPYWWKSGVCEKVKS